MPTIVPNASKKIDEAFDKFSGFQREYCLHLRALIHKALPDVIEDWKWGPNFNVNGMVCGVWAFKDHVKLVFFKGVAMKDKYKLFNHGKGNESTLSIDICEEDIIDDKKIIEYLKEAAELNKKGVKPLKRKIVVMVPSELQKALNKNKKAKKCFDSLSAYYQKDYADYIANAKQEQTRQRRLEKVMDLLDKNMTLNEKYINK